MAFGLSDEEFEEIQRITAAKEKGPSKEPGGNAFGVTPEEFEQIQTQTAQREAEKRGFGLDLLSSVIRNVTIDMPQLGLKSAKAIESVGRRIARDAVKPELHEQAGLTGDYGPIGEAATAAIETLEDFKSKSDFLAPKRDPNFISEGVGAAALSLSSRLPGAAVGAAVGSVLPGVGTLLGGIIGYVASGAVGFGLAEYQSVIDEAEKEGISRKESESAAFYSGLAESGFEFASDVLTFGILKLGKPLTKPAEETFKNGIRQIFKLGFKEKALQAGSILLSETGTEMITAGIQAEQYKKISLGDQDFWEGVAESFGPSFVASTIFAAVGVGASSLSRRSLQRSLEDKTADPEQRLMAAKEVERVLRTVDNDTANIWAVHSTMAIAQEESIDVDNADMILARAMETAPEDTVEAVQKREAEIKADIKRGKRDDTYRYIAAGIARGDIDEDRARAVGQEFDLDPSQINQAMITGFDLKVLLETGEVDELRAFAKQEGITIPESITARNQVAALINESINEDADELVRLTNQIATLEETVDTIGTDRAKQNLKDKQEALQTVLPSAEEEPAITEEEDLEVLPEEFEQKIEDLAVEPEKEYSEPGYDLIQELKTVQTKKELAGIDDLHRQIYDYMTDYEKGEYIDEWSKANDRIKEAISDREGEERIPPIQPEEAEEAPGGAVPEPSEGVAEGTTGELLEEKEERPLTKKEKSLQEYTTYIESLTDEQKAQAGDLIESEPKTPASQKLKIEKALAKAEPIAEEKAEPLFAEGQAVEFVDFRTQKKMKGKIAVDFSDKEGGKNVGVHGEDGIHYWSDPNDIKIVEEKESDRWQSGAEPIAQIPGEPIDYLDADKNLEDARAMISETDDGKFVARMPDGTPIKPKGRPDEFFETADEARKAAEDWADEKPAPTIKTEPWMQPQEIALFEKLKSDLERKGAGSMPDYQRPGSRIGYKITQEDNGAFTVERTEHGVRTKLGRPVDGFTMEEARERAIKEAHGDIGPREPIKEKPAEKQLKEPELSDIISYRSGANVINDMKGYIDAGKPFGVDVRKLSVKALDTLADYAKKGGKVFVDSGAFSAFKSGETIDFDKTFDAYDDVVEKTDGNVTVVAPDIIGDQAGTLKLIQKYGDKIKSYLDSGVDVIVPIQKGEETPDGAWNIMTKLIGSAKFRVGIPLNKKAFSDEDLEQLLKQPIRPNKFHLLGISPANRKYADKVMKIRELVDNADITSDANRILAKVGKGRPITKRQKAIVEKAKAEYFEARADEDFDDTELDIEGDLEDLTDGEWWVYVQDQKEDFKQEIQDEIDEIAKLEAPGARREAVAETAAEKTEAKPNQVGVNIHGQEVFEDKTKGRYTVSGNIRAYAPRPLLGDGKVLPLRSTEDLFKDGRYEYLTVEEHKSFSVLTKKEKGVIMGSEDVLKPVESLRPKPTGVPIAEVDRITIGEKEAKDETDTIKTVEEPKAGRIRDREPEPGSILGGTPDVPIGEPSSINIKPVPEQQTAVTSEDPESRTEGDYTRDNTKKKGRSRGRSDKGDRLQPDRGTIREPTAAEAANGQTVSKDTELESKPGLKAEDRNHVIAKDDVIFPRGVETRIKANIKAIRLLKKLEAADRNPTPKEKKTLAQYVGWGPFAQKVFNDDHDSYVKNWRDHRTPQQHFKRYDWYEDKPLNDYLAWEKKYGKALHPDLGGLLTRDEWDSASESTLNAFYTSREVIESMWDMALHMGFKNGTILEPAIGVGHFFGLMPKRIGNQSALFGVDIDSLSARISAKLYPQATVQETGYEEVRGIPDNSVDLVITNVPFGNFSVYDKKHKEYTDWSIHNYYFARSLDAVRPGGLVMGITSHWTLDAASKGNVRQYLANKADLIGAIRLPATAFKKDAGTVTTDILIFRKKDESVNVGQDFRFLKDVSAEKGQTVAVNEYFVNNPEMVLGKHSLRGTMRGGEDEYTVLPTDDLKKMLSDVIEKLPMDISGEGAILIPEKVDLAEIGAKEGALREKGGKIYVVQDGALKEPTLYNSKGKLVKAVNSKSKLERSKAYLKLRDATKNIISRMQEADATDEEIADSIKRLDVIYGKFVKRYNNVGATSNSFLRKIDNEFPIVDALEDETVESVWDEKTGKDKKYVTFSKAAMLKRRTIWPFKEPESAENIDDALKISRIYKNKVDPRYVGKLLGISDKEARHLLLEEKKAFFNPETGILETPDIYLSGNVKEKLARAKREVEDRPDLQRNIDALEAVQPDDLDIQFVYFKLGSSWVPTDTIKDFLAETFGVEARVKFARTGETSAWNVEPISGQWGVKNKEGWGTERKEGHVLLEDALNLKRTQVMDYWIEDGKRRQAINKEDSIAAQAKQDEIQAEFKQWAKGHKVWAGELSKIYNALFNGSVLRKWDVPNIDHYPGASSEVVLRALQKKFVSRGLQESTLFAYGVGTGKTYGFISLAMEMRRIGTAKKPIIAVQNATVRQYAKDFKRLYPQARVLIPIDSQRKGKNRKKLLSQIATGDWDAVVLPHSFFDGIADDPEREAAYINEQLAQIEEHLKEVRAAEGKKSFTVKEIEKLRKRKKARLQKLLDRRKDDALTFEQLGVDALLIDEAHRYKRSDFYTKMGQVKGIDQGSAQRSTGLLLKTQYVRDKTGGKNVQLATGTPISNTTAELWTMLRYIRPDILDEFNATLFDDFAANFGDTSLTVEETETGTFKQVERFNKYVNGPELLTMFHTAADVVLTQEADLELPEMLGGKPQPVIVEKTPELREYIDFLREWRTHWENLTGREKRNQRHVPLVIFGLAKKAAVDLRLVDPVKYKDNPDSKLSQVVNNTYDIWEETADSRSTQVIFLDSFRDSTKTFNAHDDMKKKLIEKGVPISDIVIVKGATDIQREAWFEKIRNGESRIIIGSTPRLGIGVNIQDKLIAAHHVDAQPRPMDVEQRNGRIVREKNENDMVRVYNYGVKNTLDSVLYDRVAKKQRFIDQMLTGDIEGRTFDEPLSEEQISFAEMNAAFAGNPLLFEKTDIDIKVRNLTILKNAWERKISGALRDIRFAENSAIPEWEKGLERDLKRKALVEKLFPEGKVEKVTFEGKEIDPKEFIKQAEAWLEDATATIKKRFTGMQFAEYHKTVKLGDEVYARVANIEGFDLVFQVRPSTKNYSMHDLAKTPSKKLTLWEGVIGPVQIGVKRNDVLWASRTASTVGGLIQGFNNLLDQTRAEPGFTRDKIANGKREIEELKKVSKEPFKEEQDLKDAIKRQQEILAALQADIPELTDDSGMTQEEAEEKRHSMLKNLLADITKAFEVEELEDVFPSENITFGSVSKTFEYIDENAELALEYEFEGELQERLDDLKELYLYKEHTLDYPFHIGTRPEYQVSKSVPFVGGKSIIELVRKLPFLSKQKVGLSPDGTLWVRTKTGQGFNIKAVQEITADRAVIEVDYGDMFEDGGFIAGKYQAGTIELQKDLADEWTLAHETWHWMEDAGFISVIDADIVSNHIKNLEKRGKWDSEGREVGGKEDRAFWNSEFLRDRSQPGMIRNILKKIADFVDMLINKVAKTARGIGRAVESGEIFDYGVESDLDEGATVPAYEIRAAEPQKPIDAFPEHARQDIEDARGIKKPNFFQRVLEGAHEVGKSLIPGAAFPSLSKKEFGNVLERLRIFREISVFSKRKAERDIKKIIGGLTPDEYDLFSYRILVGDMLSDIDKEEGPLSDWETEGLPFNFRTRDEVADTLENLISQMEQTPKAMDAFNKRQAYMKDLRVRLVREGFLPKNVLDNDEYWHHQVLDFMILKQGAGTSSADVRVHKKGSMIRRIGSRRLYNTEYVESEFEVIAHGISSLEAKKVVDDIGRNQNIIGELKAKARARNEAGTVAAYKAMLGLPQDVVLEGVDHPLFPFRRNIAMAMGRLSEMASYGELYGPVEFQRIIDNLAARAEGVDSDDMYGDPGVDSPGFFQFLSYLIQTDQNGSNWAATIFKAIRDRNNFMKAMMGKKHNTWQTILNKDPEYQDYVDWTPKPNTAWYLTSSVSDNILDQVFAGAKPLEASDIKKVLARGMDQKWVVPKKLAAVLDGADFTRRQEQPISIAGESIMNWWKRYILINPIRILKYNTNNLSGDADIAMAYDPYIFRHFNKAAKDLWKWHYNKDLTPELEAELELAEKYGIIGGGMTVHDIPDITNRMTDDNTIKAIMGEKIDLIGKAMGGWEGLKNFTTWRENILRLATMRRMQERRAAGETNLYGASNREQVDSIADPYRKDALVSRELIGDYGNLSKGGQWLRRKMIPFYSWMEINAPRYVRMIRNLPHEGERTTRAYGMAGVSLGKKGAAFAVKAMAFYTMVMLWNHFVWPEEEEALGDHGRRQLHIILGKRDDGSIITLRLQGALSDALAWFGAEDFPRDISDLATRKKNVYDWMAEDVGSGFTNRLYQSIRPDAKLMIESVGGIATYPDVFRPRPIRDWGEHAARMVSADILYRWAFGKPHRAGDRVGDRLFHDISSLITYKSDPGEIAYHTTRRWVSKYLEKQGIERPYVTPTNKSNALYYYKQALKYGDYKAAEKYLQKYKDLGGSVRSMRGSIKRGHPLMGMKTKYRKGFKESLSPKDRETLERAIQWYKSTYR